MTKFKLSPNEMMLKLWFINVVDKYCLEMWGDIIINVMTTLLFLQTKLLNYRTVWEVPWQKRYEKLEYFFSNSI